MSYLLLRNKRGRKDLNTSKPFLTLSVHRSKSTVKHNLHINRIAFEKLGHPDHVNVWYDKNGKIKLRGVHGDDNQARKVSVYPHGRLWSVSVTGLAFILKPGRYYALNDEEFIYKGESYYEPSFDEPSP